MSFVSMILLLALVLNTMIGVGVFWGKTKVSSNISYFLLVISVSFWIFSNLAVELASSHFIAVTIALLGYFSMLAISHTFFYFSYYFPRVTINFSRKIHYLIATCSAIAVLVVSIPELTIRDVVVSPWEIITGPGIYLPFAVFLGLMCVSFMILVRKSLDKALNSIEKWQIRIVLLGTITASLFGIVFNLVFPLIYGNYNLVRICPAFTIILVISVSYAIVKYKLFNLKVITTQLLTFALWIFIFTRLLVSQDSQEQTSNWVLLILSVITGIFLIRSVQAEVHQRENIETLARNLERANERLKILDRQKSEFVSIASHQLRSPLTAIKGYSSMLIEGSFGDVSAKAKEAVNRVLESSKHLVALVEDLLNISRIEQGRMVYNFTTVDLKKMTEDIIGALMPNTQRNKLKLTFTADGKEPYNTSADYEKIRQVVLNLIDNAIKYTPKGFVKVHLSKNDDKKTVVLSVADSGVGVTPELKGRLFEKFSRGDEKTKLHVNGAGLGLYVAKEMMKAHKGDIWVESPGEGKGSTFFVEFRAT